MTAGRQTSAGLALIAAILAGLALATLPARSIATPDSTTTPTTAPPRPHAGIDRLQLRIDPNVATKEELMLLPRIGPVLADAIIAYRLESAEGPAFRSADDLAGVHRIGPITVERLRPFLKLPDSGRAGP